MGKHSGKKDNEPGTDLGVPFDQMTGVQKAIEFDRSTEDPVGYADRNFQGTSGNQNGGQGGKHKR